LHVVDLQHQYDVPYVILACALFTVWTEVIAHLRLGLVRGSLTLAQSCMFHTDQLW